MTLNTPNDEMLEAGRNPWRKARGARLVDQIGDLPERLFAHSLSELIGDDEDEEPSGFFCEVQEAAGLLAEIRNAGRDCSVCNGDCSSANPSVINCPIYGDRS